MILSLPPQVFPAPVDGTWVFRACLAALITLTGCVSKPGSEVVVSVKDQKMGIYSEGRLKKQFVISTSKFGLGDEPNSYRTPLGKHEVIAKIGHGLPPGAVLKSRHWNGEVLKPNAPGRDPIVSRILWLRGLENENRNAMRRYIYIHGTTEESRLGSPASYGCIRMGMKDVVDAFDELGIGAKVVITKGHLPKGAAQPEPKPAQSPADQTVSEKPADPEPPVTVPTPDPAVASEVPKSSPMIAEPVEVKRSLFRKWFLGSPSPQVEQAQQVTEESTQPQHDTAQALPATTDGADRSIQQEPKASFLKRLFFGKPSPMAAKETGSQPETSDSQLPVEDKKKVGPMPAPDQVAKESHGSREQAARASIRKPWPAEHKPRLAIV